MTQRLTVVARRRLPWQIAVARAVVRLPWLILTRAVLPVALIVLHTTTVGRARRAAVPGWILIAAVLPLPDDAWLWTAVAAALTVTAHLTERLGRTRVLSVREQWIWQRVACGITLWQITAPAMPWPAASTLLVAVVTAGAIPWWANGNARVTPKAEPEQARKWREEVAESTVAASEIRGSQLVVDPDQSSDDVTTGRVVLAPGVRASSAAHLDEHVESLLDLPRGTITMGPRPGLSARHLSILFSRPGSGDVIRWWDGPSLDATGTYIASRTHSGAPVHDHIWHRTGAAFGVAISAPRRGKGVKMRIDAIECGLSEVVWLAAIDGKSGAGFPEIRGACDLYRGPEGPSSWGAVVDAVYAVYTTRAIRYGQNGWSRFKPGPGEPLISLNIDESLRVMTAIGRKRVAAIEDMTGGGSSLGIRIVLDAQKGDAQSMGSTTIRANLRGTGTDWIGPAGDAIARSIAVQDWDGMDPGALPSAPGWAWMASQFFDLAPVKARTVYLPSQIEVDQDGVGAPFGVAEEWADKAVHPQLHADDQAGVDSALGTSQTTGQDGPHLTVVRAPKAAADDGRSKVRKILAEADEPLQRGEIASRAGIVPRHVTDILNELQAAGEAHRGEDGWEQAS